MDPLEELQAVVGAEHARAAGAADAVDGVLPRLVCAPATAEECGEVLRLASRSGWAVSPRGAGTKLGWGNPPERVDLVLETRRLGRILEHAAGDLVLRVEAGVPLIAVQEALAGAGQMLALDPWGPAATIGGTIAANSAGPRRFRYGTVRDLLIGITVVLADGTTARSGGKVVKNVAGYDLGKLFTGSLGTLGVIVDATFRLHPRPSAQRLLEAELASSLDAATALQRLARSTLVPSSVELEWTGTSGRLSVRFEGIAPGVEAQAEAATRLLTDLGEVRPVEAAPEVELATPPWTSEASLGLKLTFLPAELASMLDALHQAAARSGAPLRVRGPAGNGVLFAAFTASDVERAAAIVTELRGRRLEGSVLVLHSPPETRKRVDAWGPVGDALPLMRRVKEQFDPARALNPGRFVGGI